MKPIRIVKAFKAYFLATVIIVSGIIASPPAKAQRNDKANLTRMIEEDRSTIDAIAGYDENIQGDIFLLAQTPEVLNIVENLQKSSEKRFREIIQDYDRDGQTALYEIARYPDLISELISHGRPSSSEVNQIVSRYPLDIHNTAKKYARSYYGVLRKIDQLNIEIDKNFQSYLAPYDEQIRESVNVLLKYPEIVSILVEDKEFTHLLGVTFREDPEWITNQIEKISQELNEQNKKDLADYKNQIENDPEAYQEMLSAADEFASETNNTRGYQTYNDPEIEVRVVNNYPFWFGYPYWYPYAYWRPYPTYYHTGFYVAPRGNVVFVGLPSNHFIFWQTHYHPTLFPHLSYSYYNYYHRNYLSYQNQLQRPVSHYGFYHSVEQNVINNPRVNNENLARIDRKRGNNIVRQPNISQSANFGRGSSAINRQSENGNNTIRQGSGSYDRKNNRGSVRRDAFPKTTPSPINTRASVGSRQKGSLNSGENQGNLRSGQTGTNDQSFQQPSTAGGTSQSAPAQKNMNRSSSGSLDAGIKNGFQPKRNGSQANPQPLRNYRNYQATEPRQSNPSSIKRENRSAPEHASPSPGKAQSSPANTNRSKSSGGGRSSRNSKEK